MFNFKGIKYFILLLLTSIGASAQDTVPHRFAVVAGYQRGFLIAHRPMVVPLQQEKVDGFELALEFQPDGSKEWHHIYDFARPGIALSFWDIGNPEQIGNVYSFIPYIDFPVIKSKRSSFDIKFGWGVGYIQKKFDADDNYKNVAVGSRVNFALILNPHYRIRINESVALSVGLSMTHYSNGSIETPNLGLNVASLGGSLTWNIGKPIHIPKTTYQAFQKNSKYFAFIAASSKQTYPADGKSFFVGTLSGSRYWQISRKSAFGAGLDLFYDHSTFQRAADQNVEITSDLEAFSGGVHGGYEMVINRLSLIVDLGAYIYTKLDNGLFYQRVGMRYKLNEKITACIHLKAHWGKADFAEFAVGYTFGNKIKLNK